MLNKKDGWFSKPGMANNDKVTKGIFLVVSLKVGKEGQVHLHVRAVVVKVYTTMITYKSSPQEMIDGFGVSKVFQMN